LFKGPDTDINLHVFSEGATEIDRMLRFRDWLRTNDVDRENMHKLNETWRRLNGGMFSTMQMPKRQ